VFQTITNVLLFIIGAVSVIMLIIGGVRYTISQGDSSAVTSAKNTILYAVIGLIVAILAYAVVNFVIVQFVATP
jgi:multisubunit Na+/H+ antiporter MnhB subunit